MSRTSLLSTLLLTIAIPASAAAQAATPPDLNDAEVAHVAVTANSIDIDLARWAQTKSQNADVKSFAALMVTDHSAVNAKAGALATRLGVTPADNAVSRSLNDGAVQARRGLEPLTGRAFDRAYIDREVGYHQAVLDAIDTVLVPTTENADLKALLGQVRPAIAAHLEHAKQLKTKLAS